MFHACKSLLFSAGYVEKSHECLIAAIEELFVDRGLLPPAIVSDLRRAKTAREAADYGLTYGKASANGTVREAEQIFDIVSGYLTGAMWSAKVAVAGTIFDIVSGYLTGEGFETPSP